MPVTASASYVITALKNAVISVDVTARRRKEREPTKKTVRHQQQTDVGLRSGKKIIDQSNEEVGQRTESVKKEEKRLAEGRVHWIVKVSAEFPDNACLWETGWRQRVGGHPQRQMTEILAKMGRSEVKKNGDGKGSATTRKVKEEKMKEEKEKTKEEKENWSKEKKKRFEKG
ncbi:hypothetical protein GPALN_004220 [Globodera pallida]|nr:hypothetical protein GPALN_004220 [Globodera pallida]